MLESLRAQWKLDRLVRSWVEFRDVIMGSLGSREITAEQESRFLALKAKIAAQLPGLASMVPASLSQEAHKQLGMMTDLLNRYRTLKVETLAGQREREEFERDWHEDYIFLNKLKGMKLSPGGARGARGEKVPTGMPRYHVRRRLPGARLVGFIVRVAILFFAVYLLGRGFGVQWSENGRFIAESPAGVSGFWQNVLTSLQSVWGGVSGVINPVVLSYGPTLTIVLFAVLLLGLGYWVFVRG